MRSMLLDQGLVVDFDWLSPKEKTQIVAQVALPGTGSAIQIDRLKANSQPARRAVPAVRRQHAFSFRFSGRKISIGRHGSAAGRLEAMKL